VNRPSAFAFRFGGPLSAFSLPVVLGALVASAAWAQQPTAQQPAAPQPQPPPTSVAAPEVPVGVELPPGYVIGTDDVLVIVFWRDKEMSTETVVRPDGKITLPLVNDLVAAGKTPDQLRAHITEAAARFVEAPTVSVVVKAINSRKVYIVGMIGKSGSFPLSGPTTVLQLISMAGGLSDFADAKNIIINRIENGRQIPLKFNYKDVQKGKKLEQNIELKPGDTVIVP
jgi:polysaccharide biosynthesis/export protein